MNKFDFVYKLIMEGIKSGYPFGKMSNKEIENRLPNSLKYCIDIKKELVVNITIHSLSTKKSHGLHLIKKSHGKTFELIDKAIFSILTSSSIENLFECIFDKDMLLISFEKFEKENTIIINIINSFYLTKSQYKKRKDEEFHIDNFDKKFKIIRIS